MTDLESLLAFRGAVIKSLNGTGDFDWSAHPRIVGVLHDLATRLRLAVATGAPLFPASGVESAGVVLDDLFVGYCALFEARRTGPAGGVVGQALCALARLVPRLPVAPRGGGAGGLAALWPEVTTGAAAEGVAGPPSAPAVPVAVRPVVVAPRALVRMGAPFAAARVSPRLVWPSHTAAARNENPFSDPAVERLERAWRPGPRGGAL